MSKGRITKEDIVTLSGSLTGAFVGSPLGSIGGHLVARLATELYQATNSTVSRMKRKLDQDFSGSCLSDVVTLERAFKDSKIKLDSNCERSGVRAGLRQSPQIPSWLTRYPLAKDQKQRNKNTLSKDSVAPLRDLIETRVKQNLPPVVVDCEAPEVACLAVLASMRLRYQLDFQILKDAPSGYSQLLRLQSSRDESPADFVITADAPFFLMTGHRLDNYRRLFPIHHQTQKILTKSGPSFARVSPIYSPTASSGREQCFLTLPNRDSCNLTDFPLTENWIDGIQGIANGDRVVVWEPMASHVLKSGKFAQSQEDYRLWISLFAHKDWTRKENKGALDAFVSIFLSEWEYCQHRPWWTMRLIRKDKNLRQSFKLAATGS